MASDLLTIAASGVRAARAALDVTSQNIANAATTGYVRRSIRLSEVSLAGSRDRIGDLSLSGVRVDGLDRNADPFRLSEVRRTASDAARGSGELRTHQNAEAAIEQARIFPALTQFEGTLQRLAADPVDPALRADALEAARSVGRTFNLAAQSLDTIASGLRFDAAAGVDRVNVLAQQLARTNVQLARAKDGTSDQVALLDQRDSLLQQISGYADVAVTIASNQTADVRLGGPGGPLLVDTVNAFALSHTVAGDGTISFSLGGPLGLSGGSLAAAEQGLVMLRDTHLRLDGIADALIAAANSVQTSGAALDGSPGQPLFSGSGASGIGVALTSGAALATAPASSPANSRDPANLNALRSALDGAGITSQVNGLLFDISAATQGRATTSEALDSIAGAARLALDSQAGVNLEEEAVNLVRFQQAFQASSKAIQVASDLLDTLLAIR